MSTKPMYAVFSGLCASTASLFGKLSGAPVLEGLLPLRVLCFLMMIVCNAFVWTLFVKALHSSRSSLVATLVSSATNYIFSAFAGFLIFGETTSILWWTGMSLVFLGLILVASEQRDQEGFDKQVKNQ